jgi:hypothetical protein
VKEFILPGVNHAIKIDDMHKRDLEKEIELRIFKRFRRY